MVNRATDVSAARCHDVRDAAVAQQDVDQDLDEPEPGIVRPGPSLAPSGAEQETMAM
jgi:hypothetical protein